MLQLVHPVLSRAVLSDPYRRRHYALVVAAAVMTLGLLLNATVAATLAAATEDNQRQQASQLFVAAPAEGSQSTVSENVTASGESAASSLSRGAAAVAAIVPTERPAREVFTVDARPPLVYPVGANAPVGSPFGQRAKACDACSTDHRGVDWNPGYGTPIVSIADGVVSDIGNPDSAYGVHLLIDHVVNGQAVTSLYAHMKSGSIAVRVGDRVRVGDQIGLVGNTGVTTAPHLHLEILVGGIAINPVPWMAANGAE